MSSSGTVKVIFIKKELATMIFALEQRLSHLQDISIDFGDPNRMNACYDEEILERVLSNLKALHEEEFGPINKTYY
jgi:hypothetical protein